MLKIKMDRMLDERSKTIQVEFIGFEGKIFSFIHKLLARNSRSSKIYLKWAFNAAKQRSFLVVGRIAYLLWVNFRHN